MSIMVGNIDGVATVGYQYIISGNTINSDMTIPIGLFKKKLNKLLLEIQKEGSPCEWENFNTMVTYKTA